MGILKNIFGGKDSETAKPAEKTFLHWLPLSSIAQLEEIKAQSKTESILIFKDSTRCGISRIVIKQFEALFTAEFENLKVYYLDLLNYRDISNEIADTFEVIHQSPQLLVIKNGFSVLDTSHHDIANVNLSRFI